MLLRRTVPATSYPVEARDVREHLRLTSGDEDYLVNIMISSACDLVGEMSGRVLQQETWAASFASLSGKLQLPKSPVIAVTSVVYFDQNDAQVTLPTSDFYLFQSEDYSEMQPKPGKQWPVAIARDDAITITFTAGYTVIPPALRGAILLTVGHLYENRAASVIGETVARLPIAVEEMVAIHRLGWAAG